MGALLVPMQRKLRIRIKKHVTGETLLPVVNSEVFCFAGAMRKARKRSSALPARRSKPPDVQNWANSLPHEAMHEVLDASSGRRAWRTSAVVNREMELRA